MEIEIFLVERGAPAVVGAFFISKNRGRLGEMGVNSQQAKTGNGVIPVTGMRYFFLGAFNAI